MITFYDLAAQEPIKTWSPNPWKTRYVLNYKQLPYQTVALEYPEIEPEFIKIGIPSLQEKPDGSPPYTCPSIVDGEHGVSLSDSFKIAQYLDKAYPNTPKVFPRGSEALQKAFYDQFQGLLNPLWPLYLPRLPEKLMNPPSAEYFTRTRSMWFGKPLKDFEPAEGEERAKSWKEVQTNFGAIDGWMSKSSGPFFMGDAPTFADFTVVSLLKALKIGFGEESEEWKNIQTWHRGRWEDLVNRLEKYATQE